MKKLYTLLASVAIVAAGNPALANAPRTATFDDLTLEPESAWFGDREDEDYMYGSFQSGDFEFKNLYMADWDFWAFYSYTNHTATSFDMSTYEEDQFNSVTGGGYDGSSNYCVAYVDAMMGYSDITIVGIDEPCTVTGVFVTNTAWVEDAILNGDGMSDKFETGDYLTLTATALVDGMPDANRTATIYLADYTSEDPANHYYLKDWTWMPLDQLGNVDGIRFSMTTTKSNAHGATTPMYVCLDNLGHQDLGPETGISAIIDNSNAPVEYYDLQGNRLNGNNLHPGIVIRRQGSTAAKMVVR